MTLPSPLGAFGMAPFIPRSFEISQECILLWGERFIHSLGTSLDFSTNTRFLQFCTNFVDCFLPTIFLAPVPERPCPDVKSPRPTPFLTFSLL